MIVFSVIIPTFNRANLIGKTIKSLLSQSYSNFEIIVVDDGSTDNTEEVVKKIQDDRIQYFKKENAERGAARNYGAKKAKGEYINYFDSDDLAYPNHLETAIKTITLNNSLEIFHLSYDIKLPSGELLKTPPPIYNINHQIINGNLLSCNGVFIQKDIALTNPFNETRTLSASEDYLLWMQLAAKYKIYHNNTVTSTIINHDERSVIKINKNGLITRKELMINNALNDPSIIKTYNNKLYLIKLNAYAYISLHLVLANYKEDSLKYLLKSLKVYPLFILDKRFFAIIKYHLQ